MDWFWIIIGISVVGSIIGAFSKNSNNNQQDDNNKQINNHSSNDREQKSTFKQTQNGISASEANCRSCGGLLNQEGSVFVCQECGETFKRQL